MNVSVGRVRVAVITPKLDIVPRRNRPQRSSAPPELPDERVRRGVEGVQQWQDGEWMVRSIFGGAAVKTYRCPGCMHEIRPGVAHVVAWPVDGRGDEAELPGRLRRTAGQGAEDRRHWHTGCWRARDRRGPGVERSRNAPRYGRG
jgi:hypothetical protein